MDPKSFRMKTSTPSSKRLESLHLPGDSKLDGSCNW